MGKIFLKFDNEYVLDSNILTISSKIETFYSNFIKGKNKGYTLSYFVSSNPSGSIFLKDCGEHTLIRIQSSSNKGLKSLDDFLGFFEEIKYI